jgi:hypothetical protein
MQLLGYNFTSATCEKFRTDRAICSINKVSLGFLLSKAGSIRDHLYRTCGENSLELIELPSINKVSLV